MQEKTKDGDLQKAEAAFATADAIVEAEYALRDIHHACLETHGMVVDYRGGDQRDRLCVDSRNIHHSCRRSQGTGSTAECCHFGSQHMGGGFGSKFGIGTEGMFACRLSKETKSPVKLMLTRYDEFVMTGNRSASWQKIKAGVKKDGTSRCCCNRDNIVSAASARVHKQGQPYIYRGGETYREIYALHTNEDSSNAMRAPGHPQASFAIESLMDELAYKIKMDPVAFRKKNLRDEVYHRQLDRGAKEIGWSRRNPIAGGNPGPLKRGFGCAVGTWGGGGNNQCKVDVTVSRDGSVSLLLVCKILAQAHEPTRERLSPKSWDCRIKDVIEQIGNSKLGAANAVRWFSHSCVILAVSERCCNQGADAHGGTSRGSCSITPNPRRSNLRTERLAQTDKSISWKQACSRIARCGNHFTRRVAF